MANQDELTNVVIVGCGGFGREVLEILREKNKIKETWNIVGFVDDNIALHGKTINKLPVLGGIDWLNEHKRNDISCICAIGNCLTRKTVVKRLEETGTRFINVIHPSVMMSEFVELGNGIIICAGSILTVNIKIGNHVQIDSNCTVMHDARLGDYCRINPGVKISGNDNLNEGVYIGSGATLIQQISIGKWSTIGAGAVVVDNIPANVTAVGVPARIINKKQ